ncbi:MAG TPA: response regulator [Ktedonobacterales bacterium]|nr:response regulator [Ktedonobacterales bacterium]
MASRVTVAHNTIERAGFKSHRIGDFCAPTLMAGETRTYEARSHAPAAWDRRSVHLAPLAAPEVIYGAPPTPKWPGQPGGETAPKSALDAPSAQTIQPLVLVVEDEESIAETLALIVEEVGYTPIIARNGREALALARRYHPRLIITDLMMPFVSGAEFIAAARVDANADGYPFPPVVVVTAASRSRAEQAGADVVITKPFDVLKVEAAIQRLVEGQPS